MGRPRAARSPPLVLESGGAVADMGRARAYLSPDGYPLPWLQSIDSIAVNGRHAIYIAEGLVRIEMLRIVRTYEVITQHAISVPPGQTRPEISPELLFRGQDGVLPLDLWKEEHRAVRGELAPTFYSRAGEPVEPPARFEEAIRKITDAACCVGCRHIWECRSCSGGVTCSSASGYKPTTGSRSPAD